MKKPTSIPKVFAIMSIMSKKPLWVTNWISSIEIIIERAIIKVFVKDTFLKRKPIGINSIILKNNSNTAFLVVLKKSKIFNEILGSGNLWRAKSAKRRKEKYITAIQYII